MGVYFLKDEGLTFGKEFELENAIAEDMSFDWSAVEEPSEIIKELFRKVSVVTLLIEMLNNADKRKISLKLYKERATTIENFAETVNLKDYPWMEVEKDSIYNLQEQEKIKKLFLYLYLKGKEDTKDTQTIMFKLFPYVKEKFQSEKNLKNEKVVYKAMLSDKDFSATLSLEERFLIQKALDNGFLADFKNRKFNQMRKGFFYNEYISFFACCFYDEYINPFKDVHILVASKFDEEELIRWAFARNVTYLQHNEKNFFQIMKEYFSNKFEGTVKIFEGVSPKEKKEIKIGPHVFSHRNRINIIQFLDRICLQLEDEITSTLKEMAEEERDLIVSDNGSIIKSHFLAPKESDGPLDAQKMLKDIIDDRAARKGFEGVDFIYGEILYLKNLQSELLSSIQVVNNFTNELLQAPILDEYWFEIKRALEQFRAGYVVYMGEGATPEELEEEKADSSEHYFGCELSFVVSYAMMILQRDKEKIKKENAKKGKKNKKKETSQEFLKNNEATADVIEMAKELEQKLLSAEQSLRKVTSEKDALSEKNRQLSKENAYTTSLKEKVDNLENTISELQKQLEQKEVIVLEKQVATNELSNEEVLDKLMGENERVIMVGGHHSLGADVQSWIPAVSHIESREYFKKIPIDATVVIINTSYLNHSMFYKTKKRIDYIRTKHDVQVIYINTQLSNREHFLKEVGLQLKLD